MRFFSFFSMSSYIYVYVYLVGHGLKRNMSDEAISVRVPIIDSNDNSTDSESDYSECESTIQITPADRTPTVSTATNNVIPVTPLVVGEVMSKDDPFYTPHKDNPFVSRFKDANTKLVGSLRDNWEAWFELPSPNPYSPPTTPRTREDSSSVYIRPTRIKLRRCHSLPGSPNLARKEIDRFQYEMANYSPRNVVYSRRPYGTVANIKKILNTSIGANDDLYDARSDGSSSTDSAVELMVRDLKGAHITPTGNYRKCSIETGATVNPFEKYRNQYFTRYLESKILDDAIHKKLFVNPKLSSNTDEDLGAHSFSSSESCMSLDECSILSPTSSYSSYSEESERWSRAQFELYEHRLRSREKFQELVRRWEAKQIQDGKMDKNTSLSEGQRSHHHHKHTLLTHDKSEHGDAHLERKFQELKHKWENKESIEKSGPRTVGPSSHHNLSQKSPFFPEKSSTGHSSQGAIRKTKSHSNKPSPRSAKK